MKKYNITIQAKIINICVASIMFITGIILAVFLKMPEDVLKIIVGCMCILTGASKILGYFSNDIYRLAFQHDFAVGILNIILGILSFILKGNVRGTISTAIGVYVILDALLKVQTGLDARIFGMRAWKGILISSAAVALIGIFPLIAPHADVTVISLNIPIGVAMVANATINAWITMYTVKVRAKKKNFNVDIDLGE